MKNSILFIGIILLSMSFIGCNDDILSKIQDSAFKQYCCENFDTNKDGKLSRKETEKVTEIICSFNLIDSLKGLEYFPNLTKLYCDNNRLTSLDVSKNTKLIEFLCDMNQLTSLDVSKNSNLINLSCFDNQLTSLDVSRNPKLESLDCSYNQLRSLDVSKNPELTKLHFLMNYLTSLDVSKNRKLKVLKTGRVDEYGLQSDYYNSF